MAEQFANLSQTYASHDQSTGEGVPVAMPRVVLDLRFSQNGCEPTPRSIEMVGVSTALRRSRSLLPA